MLVSVKAAYGRLAYTAPVGGAQISNTDFKMVKLTPWIAARLACGDIIRAPDEPAMTPPPPEIATPAAVAPPSRASKPIVAT
jgi:hypothetical protein